MSTPKQNDGGPAFPLPASTQPNGEHQWHEYGMSLRDWFAGQALDLASKLEHDYPTGLENQPTYAGIATRAYYMADAMIAAREVKP